MSDISDLWTPKFAVEPQDRLATAGSCFAQHIGRSLAQNGFNWIDGEQAPAFLSERVRQEYGYGIFSFRTGNIYTVALLRQWVRWAFGAEAPSSEIWEYNGRFYDPFRPAIEPNGFVSPEEMSLSRQTTLNAIRATLSTCQVFIFTLGLTEAWRNKQTGVVYQSCPGTVAGSFDSAQHVFVNYDHGAILEQFDDVRNLLTAHNPKLRYLLTVSPVPLTATATDAHVLVATTYSKSVLRSVAGQLAQTYPDSDYFPSYEIITSPPFRGQFFNENLRTVASGGINFVLAHFFAAVGTGQSTAPEGTMKVDLSEDTATAESCEDELLSAFAPTS